MLSQLTKAITKHLFGGANPIGKISTSLELSASGKIVAEALLLPLETTELAKFIFKMKCAINTLVRESKTGLVKLILYALASARMPTPSAHISPPHTTLPPVISRP